MKKVWIVNEGKYYHDDYIFSVYATKKSAEKETRKDGFKWNKKDQMFLNDKEQLYRKIDSEEVKP
jgi:hypothetical protein